MIKSYQKIISILIYMFMEHNLQLETTWLHIVTTCSILRIKDRNENTNFALVRVWLHIFAVFLQPMFEVGRAMLIVTLLATLCFK